MTLPYVPDVLCDVLHIMQGGLEECKSFVQHKSEFMMLWVFEQVRVRPRVDQQKTHADRAARQ